MFWEIKKFDTVSKKRIMKASEDCQIRKRDFQILFKMCDT